MNPICKWFVVDRARVQRLSGKLCVGGVPMLLFALCCSAAMAQQSSQQTGTEKLSNNPLRYENGRVDPSEMSGDTSDPIFEHRRLHQLNVAKYKSITEKTEKLLKLITDLNAEVASTNPDSLTPEQLRKIAAIEKLARSVKDEMRTPLQVTPVLTEAARPPGGSADTR